MKMSWFLASCMLYILLISSCSQNLPDHYGIYANTEKGMIPLSGQKILFKGNLLESVTGLKSPTGIDCAKADNFIVYKENTNSEAIRLSQFEFKRWGSVQNIMRRSNVEVNLWVASTPIDINIAPIKGRTDMYKITPSTQLANGFYAIHFGELGNRSTIEASMGNIVYDFVIGSTKDYPSYEVMKKRNEERLTKAAHNLLKELNAFYNRKEVDKIKSIYRPNGEIFSDKKWEGFLTGLNTWFEEAGNVEESKIIKSSLTENKGIFTVHTLYAKKGKQTEKLVIQNLNGKYYITSLE